MALLEHNPLTDLSHIVLRDVVELSLVPTEARFNLRVRPSSLASLSSSLDLRMPERMGQIVRSQTTKVICVGPDEWMISTTLMAGSELKRKLEDASRATVMSVVDITDRMCSLRVAGPKAAYCIQGACPHEVSAMPVDTATRTLFEQADVLVEREDQAVFRLEMLRSWSTHVASLMSIIGREVATGL